MPKKSKVSETQKEELMEEAEIAEIPVKNEEPEDVKEILEEDEDEDDSVPKKKKMEILDPVSFQQDPTNLTLILYEEDHTIGNSVKHLLTRMDDVEFCGYNVPHPLEDKILLRVQTKHGVNALQVLMKALEDLESVFQTIEGKFQQAHATFA